jgi:hypothetical protein
VLGVLERKRICGLIWGVWQFESKEKYIIDFLVMELGNLGCKTLGFRIKEGNIDCIWVWQWGSCAEIVKEIWYKYVMR